MDELKNKRILLVDDEAEILTLLENALFKEGFYHIVTAGSCREAIKIVEDSSIALYVLDVNLPDGNGFGLFSEIRKHSQAPVIFLTARGEADDKYQGLGLGADDYIVKPFLTREFILRVTALLRRTYKVEDWAKQAVLTNRIIDFETAQVVSSVKNMPPVTLTAKEFILAKKLYENKNRIVTNDALCLAAWGDEYYGYENTLMVHIRRLREKIEENPSKPRHLLTIKGLGYKLMVDHE